MTRPRRSGGGDPATLIRVWRHPKPRNVVGRCIGRTDVLVDPRKAKNLAHRIRTWARRQGTARVVITSPLRRGVDVGRCLAGWGWEHRVDARLNEVDFGEWDGKHWDQIGALAVDAWCLDFAQYAPGGGESVSALLQRCRQFIDELSPAGALVVGHAGWISAARWLQGAADDAPTPASWPRAVGYGQMVALNARPAAVA